jgi:hypothetical protein
MSVGGLVIFCLLGLLLGIILFRIVYQIKSTHKKVAGFLLKMDKKISLLEHFKYLKAFSRQDKILKRISQMKIDNSIMGMYRAYRM